MSRIVPVHALIVVMWLIDPAATAAADLVVHPEGNAVADVPNVRAAVAAGGVVLLKATNADGVPTAFEFGRTGTRGC
jgi:hypothetical protein